MQSDIDLIAIVSEERFADWIDRIGTFEDENDGSYSMGKMRRLIASAMTLEATWLLRGNKNTVDIFLFPADWDTRLDELQELGNHKDPNFMINIMSDAVDFNTKTKRFSVAENRRIRRFAEEMMQAEASQEAHARNLGLTIGERGNGKSMMPESTFREIVSGTYGSTGESRTL